ncbi:MAG: TetR/AcrR family transcriptional regulator, partial [Acidobacteria bacterium]|nr:TetR/AcrR family transcriptional regulator [Acidobacteriota bacterium]
MNKGLATKKAILREALALVSRIGFEAVSIAQLAEAVGLSKSGLYAHFRDKEGLQLELLDEATELFRETVISPAREAPAGEPRVRAIFSNWMHWAELEELPGGCIFMTAA